MEEFVGRNIWNLLLIGFVGGLILNVMPCVLPVLGLKVMHHISASKRSYISSLVSACMYTLGILVSFWIIALLLFFLQKADMSYGWGFQLQNPYFVAFLMFVFLLISANLFGLFESGTSIATWAQESEESIKEGQFKHRYLVPFFSGILMMLVSTPCTGPLLGAIIGLSSSLPLVNSLLLYSSIALGVASPFLLAGLIPLPITSWLLPKPGPWMNTVKQFLGFLLLLSSIWLLWALSSLAPEMVYELAILGTFFLFFGAWLYGKSQIHTNSFLGKVSFFFSLLFLLIAMTCTIGSFNPNVRQNLSSFFLGKELEWQPFSFERLQKEVEGGKIVLVDASARWCLTCQSNDFVFTQEELKKYLIEKQVILLRADWTKRNSEITKWLHSMQRNGVPTIALYKQGKEVILLPELITTDIVKNSVNTIVEEKK